MKFTYEAEINAYLTFMCFLVKKTIITTRLQFTTSLQALTYLQALVRFHQYHIK